VDECKAGIADIAKAFLKIGAVSYGGPAIVGIMQTELQEKRRWLAKQNFVEGLALVNMLPGPHTTDLVHSLSRATRSTASGPSSSVFLRSLSIAWPKELSGVGCNRSYALLLWCLCWLPRSALGSRCWLPAVPE
jgi:hypothetical protein